MDSLVTLLHDDVEFSMPPYPMWLVGPSEVAKFMLGAGSGCRGSRVIVTSANGSPAYASYRPAEPGRHEPWSIVVLETSDGRIKAIHNFLDTSLFEKFGLPGVLES